MIAAIDQIAVDRHRAFGRAIAEQHYKKFPGDIFTGTIILPVMREAMGDIAADHGVGSAALEPLARVAAAGFLRRWRNLSREARYNRRKLN